MDRAAGRKVRGVAPGGKVDCDQVGDDRDVGVGERRALECLLDRPAGGVGDVDDAAVAVTAFTRQMPAFSRVVEIERDAKFGEPRDRGGGAADDMLDHGEVVEAGARDHRVADMILKTVARLKHRGDPALCPFGRAAAKLALGEHRNALGRGQVERGGQPGGAGADDQHVERRVAQTVTARVRLRKTSSRSGSRVETSTMPSPALPSAASTSPALARSLR